ncbi:hypothetical protein [Leptospira bouyouniensis]|uniref:Flagellar assembly protein FlaA n=1 Tax=Leptospira bouyouniensis TaxID=2484911 RepID=A0ABY2L1E7_9LEPT|nr:hypothetical protein [Leptospira bouyouniensis]TGK46639.1 hypothetical protein EHQ10_14815 [Leptospira bouyouniensis]
MKYILICCILFITQCAFANLEHQLRTFPKELEKNKIDESITILNQNRMFFQKGHKRYVEINPMFGMPWNEYFSKQQKQIGYSRYQWKTVYVHNIDDKNFELTNVKTDYVLFVVANRPKSDWEEGNLGQVLQMLTLCLYPCQEKLNLEITVKLYHQNRLVTEKKNTQMATRYISPWYIFIPNRFQKRDFGNAFNEPNIVSTMYLQGFQEAIDEISLNLRSDVANESNDVP